MPRSIIAMRSRWRIAIARMPPTITNIGIANGVKKISIQRTESLLTSVLHFTATPACSHAFPAIRYSGSVDLEKTLLRKTGEAIHRFNMIREGDRLAVAVSGGKDSVALLEALLLLQKRAPIDFSVSAFTIEQGKFLAPVAAVGEYIRSKGVEWTCHTDNPSLRLLEEQPGHGCDICSRFRRRAVYQIARGLGANVIAFGHTADDLCESLLRNILYTGRISSLPAVTYSKQRDFRLIRPLIYVTEEVTRAYCESKGIPVVPCGCSLRAGTVRKGIRETIADWEREHPRLRENILSAMGNINPGRLLDTRYLDPEGEIDEAEVPAADTPLHILQEV